MNNNFIYSRWGNPRRGLVSAAVTLIFLAAAMLVGAAGRPAEAAVSGVVFWTVDLTFPNNAPKATLLVEIGDMTPNGFVVTDSKLINMTCKVTGSLPINKGKATFDGSSYLRCLQPSIPAVVLDMTNGQYTIPPACEAEKPYVKGFVRVDPRATTGVNLPTYHHPDWSHWLVLDGAGSLTQGMGVESGSASSGSFTPVGGIDKIGAQFVRQGLTLNYQTMFGANGSSLGGFPAVVNGPLPISTLATPIYFGYSPDSGTYFKGEMKSLQIDPPCIGKG